uniref:N-acetylmuramoyl-L-alanine amidase n=1 Tax=Mycena chlorophos TaxID=658473 RepID=A0ABQ0LR34_MYCCL|nr:predicted protein [Mycena chlorophos]
MSAFAYLAEAQSARPSSSPAVPIVQPAVVQPIDIIVLHASAMSSSCRAAPDALQDAPSRRRGRLRTRNA